MDRRSPPVPLLAVLLGVAGLVSVWVVRDAEGVELCHIKRVTGVPCPTCGTTRGVLAALEGRPLDAWLWNPLVFSVASIVAGLLLLRVVAQRRVVLELSAHGRRWAWAAAALTLLANWLYLLRTLPEL